VLSVVSAAVNYSGSNGVKHRTFHSILQEANAEHVNSVCHTRRFLESLALKFLVIVKCANRGRKEDAEIDNSTFLLGIFRY
jgi:hypothetical protein